MKKVLKKNGGLVEKNDISRSDYKEETRALMEKVLQQKIDLVNLTAENLSWCDHYNKYGNMKELQKLNHMIQRRLVLICAAPLVRGIRPESVAASMGMFIGSYLTNPALKKGLHEVQAKQLNKMSQYLEDNPNPLVGQKGIDILNAKAKYHEAQVHGRVPYTAETAALAEISLLKSAYDQMREDGVNKQEVMENFQDARQSLRDLAGKDGVNKENIQAQVSDQILRFQAEAPEFQDVFSELSYDGFQAAEPREVIVPQKDRFGNEVKPLIFEVYDQGWTDRYGNPMADFDFNPRMPIDKNLLADHMSATMLNHLHTLGSPEENENVMNGIYQAWQDVYRPDIETGCSFVEDKGQSRAAYDRYKDILICASIDGVGAEDAYKTVGLAVSTAGAMATIKPGKEITGQDVINSAYARSFARMSYHLDTKSDDWYDYVNSVAKNIAEKDGYCEAENLADLMHRTTQAYQIGVAMGCDIKEVHAFHEDREKDFIASYGNKDLVDMYKGLDKGSDEAVIEAVKASNRASRKEAEAQDSYKRQKEPGGMDF